MRFEDIIPEQEVYIKKMIREISQPDMYDELYQNMMEKILSYSHTILNPQKIQPWLRRVACHLVVDYYREKSRVISFTDLITNEQDMSELVDYYAVDHNTPETIYMQNDIEQLLEERIQDLPEPFKTCLIRTNLLEKRYEDVAEQLNVPLGTVRSRVSRAKAKLRTMFKHD